MNERDTGTAWAPPRCSHGHILLGCPHHDCTEQSEYLAQQKEALDAYMESLWWTPGSAITTNPADMRYQLRVTDLQA